MLKFEKTKGKRKMKNILVAIVVSASVICFADETETTNELQTAAQAEVVVNGDTPAALPAEPAAEESSVAESETEKSGGESGTSMDGYSPMLKCSAYGASRIELFKRWLARLIGFDHDGIIFTALFLAGCVGLLYLCLRGLKRLCEPIGNVVNHWGRIRFLSLASGSASLWGMLLCNWLCPGAVTWLPDVMMFLCFGLTIWIGRSYIKNATSQGAAVKLATWSMVADFVYAFLIVVFIKVLLEALVMAIVIAVGYIVIKIIGIVGGSSGGDGDGSCKHLRCRDCGNAWYASRNYTCPECGSNNWTYY